VLGVPRLIRAFADMAERFPYVEHRNGAYGNTLVVREPVGVVGSIIPWNGALFESLLKMAPALLAGCTGVIKLPIETPLDGYALADCFVEAGLPKGVISILTADRDVSESLVRNPQIDKISFTGSTAVGRRIGSICGGDLRRFTLELGGKSAAILLEDGNLELAYGAVKASALGTNGQQCFALTRVLVPQSRYAEAVDFFAAKMSELTVGDPFDPATDIGPLITGRQRDRVKDYVRSARDEGARIVVGGDGSGGQDRGWFVEPTLIADATPTMRVVREEIFGPVISVLPFLDEDDAIRLSNDSEYGLNGAVFTSDQDHGIQVGRQIRSGIFTVNGFRMNWEAPFGGFKSSGIGREYGPEGLAAWTELKSINLVDAT
jgi:betaine-aldehyde dehydrogenase